MRFDYASDLVKVAQRRIEDARELLMRPSLKPERGDADQRHLPAAYYLAGYAVECILKAYAVDLYNSRERADIKRWSEVADRTAVDVSGAEGHNLGKLLVVCELEGRMQANPAIMMTWGTCSAWRHDVRYTLMPVAASSAAEFRRSVREFVDACDVVYRWVKQRG
jgi:hypothetical protein